MMKFPVGVQTFEKIREDSYVYVDKTEMLYQLVTTGTIYFLSRPRRFGKSLLVSTLKNYFQGRKELFQGLAIERLEKDWLEYPVFHIDFNTTNFLEPGNLEAKLNGYVSDWERIYGQNSNWTTIGDRFAYVLGMEIKTHIQGTEYRLEDWNRSVLKSFYSVFKGADADLQFVLLTGVTKFSQVSVFSGFNQPLDISMDKRYEALCGITQEELENYFAEPIRELAGQEGISEAEMLQRLKDHYDGYYFSTKLTDIYNPYSLLSAFAQQELLDYWFRTGTPTYLLRLLAHSHENLDEMTGRYYDPSEFVDYKADVEKPLPMIYQSGYLTIKDYKPSRGTFLLDFPNKEVKKGFVSLVAAGYWKPEKESVEGWIQDLLDAMEAGEPDTIRDLFTSFLASIPYTARRKEDQKESESYFNYTFYLIFRMVSVYATYIEKEQSQGRSDCIVETPQYVYIFEFKLDGTADEALKQIEDKGYARPYAADKRKLFKIGATFSSRTGTIEEWKQK